MFAKRLDPHSRLFRLGTKTTAPKYILSKMLCHTGKKENQFLFSAGESFWILKDFCHKLQHNFSMCPQAAEADYE